jgi:hypothetical protein
VRNELTAIPEIKYEVARTAQVNANHFNNILIINK